MLENAVPPAQPTVRLLEPSDLDAAATALASAFAGDPLVRHTFGEAEHGLALGFRITAGSMIGARSAYGVFVAEKLAGVALFQQPGAELRLLQALRLGLVKLPFVVGLRHFRRMLHSASELERFKATLLEGEPYFYLDTLGVRSEAQRRGLGGVLLNQALPLLRGGRSAPCLVLTHMPANVPFYERLGFRVRGEHDYLPAKLRFWGMVRAPER
jgi:ribosomal protein S18 acetylase RimI-like enzyme